MRLVVIVVCALLCGCGQNTDTSKDVENNTTGRGATAPGTTNQGPTVGAGTTVSANVRRQQSEIEKEIEAARASKEIRNAQTEVANNADVAVGKDPIPPIVVLGSAKVEMRLPPPVASQMKEIQPQKDFAETLKMALEGAKALYGVLFVTNRKIAGGAELQLEAITTERSPNVTYGFAVVGVPKAHLIGHVERPKSYILGSV